jgi:hypothetical protein
MEMPRHGKRGKPNGGFPSFPTALGNRQPRDFHIPTGPTTASLSTNPTSVRALRALAKETSKPETPCRIEAEQGITSGVRTAFSIGRFWGDHHWPVLK